MRRALALNPPGLRTWLGKKSWVYSSVLMTGSKSSWRDTELSSYPPLQALITPVLPWEAYCDNPFVTLESTNMASGYYVNSAFISVHKRRYLVKHSDIFPTCPHSDFSIINLKQAWWKNNCMMCCFLKEISLVKDVFSYKRFNRIHKIDILSHFSSIHGYCLKIIK